MGLREAWRRARLAWRCYWDPPDLLVWQHDVDDEDVAGFEVSAVRAPSFELCVGMIQWGHTVAEAQHEDRVDGLREPDRPEVH